MLRLRDFLDQRLKSALFCIGLSLTIYKGFDSVKKYRYANLSTKVTMMNSFETILPVIAVCPDYLEAFNIRLVESCSCVMLVFIVLITY